MSAADPKHDADLWSLLPVIERYARVFVPDDEAHDVALDTIAALRRYPPPEEGYAPLARLIARHRCIDRLRSRQRRSTFPLDSYEEMGSPPAVVRETAEDTYLSTEMWETLRAGLTAEEFRVLLFSYQMEMTLAEIARYEDRSLSSIYNLRARALQKARRILSKDGDTGSKNF